MICDYAHGAGDVQAAAINCKVSSEATAANVRVRSWAHDPRRIFAEIGGARSRSLVAKYYLKHKLTLPGHVVVPSPGEPAIKSRRLMTALLTQPFKVLTMDTDCNILIPDDAEISRACPVVLPPDAGTILKQWRETHTRPPLPAIGGAAERRRWRRTSRWRNDWRRGGGKCCESGVRVCPVWLSLNRWERRLRTKLPLNIFLRR